MFSVAKNRTSLSGLVGGCVSAGAQEGQSAKGAPGPGPRVPLLTLWHQRRV